jgi:predicted NBD/HSP70 family sugar kinase
MYSLGVDIGGTKIAAGVVDELGNLVDRAEAPTPHGGPEGIDRAVADTSRCPRSSRCSPPPATRSTTPRSPGR